MGPNEGLQWLRRAAGEVSADKREVREELADFGVGEKDGQDCAMMFDGCAYEMIGIQGPTYQETHRFDPLPLHCSYQQATPHSNPSSL
jgi:hypothetical protein